MDQMDFTGPFEVLCPHEIGWKDTVALNVGDEVVITMRVAGFKGKYVFHCTISNMRIAG